MSADTDARRLARSTTECRSTVCDLPDRGKVCNGDGATRQRASRVRCLKENLRPSFGLYALTRIGNGVLLKEIVAKRAADEINHSATNNVRSITASDADCSPFTVSRSDWWIYATSHALSPRWRSENLTLRARRSPRHPLRPNRFPYDCRSSRRPRHSV